MRLAHHLTIRNSQDCMSPAEEYGTPLYVTREDRVPEQFESYKKAPGARYTKVQVLLKGTQIGLMRRAETIDDLTAATERPAWQT